jgi:hypothetical protein
MDSKGILIVRFDPSPQSHLSRLMQLSQGTVNSVQFGISLNALLQQGKGVLNCQVAWNQLVDSLPRYPEQLGHPADGDSLVNNCADR